MKIYFLYDDRELTPPAIRQIIGVDRFSSVVFRKRRQSLIIHDLMEQVRGVELVTVSDEADCKAFTDLLDHATDQLLVLRIPSFFAPRNPDVFAQIVRKLPYAPGPALFSERIDGENVALLTREDALALLHARSFEARRPILRDLHDRVLMVDNIGGFHDLRDVSGFLSYMIGATEARHFNAINIEGNVYRKSSADRGKMHGEYRFFHIVPETMKRFLLPTFGFTDNGTTASYAMERLAVPDAALQLVHHSFSPRSFDNLMALFFEFDQVRERRPMPAADVRAVAAEAIIGKTVRRLDDLMQTPAGLELDRLMVAAGPIGGIDAIMKRAIPLLERAFHLYPAAELAVSHGDPCFSNILFNQDLSLFRLIDPRGGETVDDCLMHPLYDVAKFSHSVLGSYDFINNGLFDLQLDGTNRLKLELEGGGPPAWMRTAFLERLQGSGYDPRLVRTVEMSLFLSMLPLHIDVPRKLPAFCLIACDLILQLENEF